MYELTKYQHSFYSQLVKQYSRDNWAAVCGLDRFLDIQFEKAINANNSQRAADLRDIIEYAQNDY